MSNKHDNQSSRPWIKHPRAPEAIKEAGRALKEAKAAAGLLDSDQPWADTGADKHATQASAPTTPGLDQVHKQTWYATQERVNTLNQQANTVSGKANAGAVCRLAS